MWWISVSWCGHSAIGECVSSESGRMDESIIQTHGSSAKARMVATGSSVPSSRRSFLDITPMGSAQAAPLAGLGQTPGRLSRQQTQQISRCHLSAERSRLASQHGKEIGIGVSAQQWTGDGHLRREGCGQSFHILEFVYEPVTQHARGSTRYQTSKTRTVVARGR
jgi:hypothetical protein